ncbi:hypothetical protein [Sediminibacterium ginsengisoli]|uniref:Lipoprotein n=1 Tax=Sediminibacterium ginsengisoli TaxID=413434 RepID=A0A1T4PN52_9BACT|nr:hypothetical protein [Sediminibacterium ginsengisoli]SJZ92990.1 hypothetical protein SAMN04488132_106115 [Sediminibacterium ginsengisoli]
MQYSKAILFTALLILLQACTNSPKAEEQTGADTIRTSSYDKLSPIREKVKESPVASVSSPVPDDLNQWKFAVQVYQTEKRFTFLVRMQYKELRASDSLVIPNLGLEPVVEIRKGSTPMSCIIGFLDKKQMFMPYKKVSVNKEKLSFTTIQHYNVGTYKTVKK